MSAISAIQLPVTSPDNEPISDLFVKKVFICLFFLWTKRILSVYKFLKLCRSWIFNFSTPLKKFIYLTFVRISVNMKNFNNIQVVNDRNIGNSFDPHVGATVKLKSKGATKYEKSIAEKLFLRRIYTGSRSIRVNSHDT